MMRSARNHFGTHGTVVAAVLVVMLLAGCQGTRPLAITGHTQTRPVEYRQEMNVVAIDPGLTGSWHGDIQVAGQHTKWTPDGRLKIVVEFENRTREGFPVQIQTHFKDANGRFLADQTAWETVPLPRNQTSLYEAAAATKEAEFAHVRVRRAVAR